MIQKYDIEVEGYGRLDTYDDLDISFTYNFENLEELSSRTSKYSKTILLPDTPNNNKFFKYLGELQITNSYNSNKRVRCNVRIGDNNIFPGYLKLESINKSFGSDNYEVTIISIDKNLFEEIGDDSLVNLDLSQYNHIRSKTNIQNSWDTSIYKNGSTTPFQLGQGYVYPRIFYGNYISSTEWFTYDCFPAVYVKTIIDTIFEKYGYSYKSNFIESDYFRKLILPFNRSNIELSSEEIQNRLVIAGIETGSSPLEILNNELQNTSTYFTKNPIDGITDESTDILNQWDGSVFTCNKQGFYNISFTAPLVFRYTNLGGQDFSYVGDGGTKHFYKLNLTRANGTTITISDSGMSELNPFGEVIGTPSDTLLHPTPWYDEFGMSTISLIKDNLYLEPGDTISIEFYAQLSETTQWSVGTNNIRMMPVLYWGLNGVFTEFKVEVADPILMGDEELNMNQILPDMKINEFFKGIVNMFNLAIISDPENENNLIIEPIEEYLDSKNKIEDWSDLLDRDEEIELIPTSNLTSQKYEFTYKEDDDYFNKKYQSDYNEVYGYEEKFNDNDFNIKSEKIELPFSPTPNASHFNLQNTVMPWFVDIDNKNEIIPRGVNPRILFYGGLLDGNTIKLKEGPNDSSPVTLTQYPYCGHWDHPTNPTYDLNFDKTKRIYWNSISGSVDNLYNKFHRNYLESVVNPDGRILKGKFNLKPNHISSLDIRDTIQIDGVDFRILSVNDYNPIAYDKTTEVELIKLIEFETYFELQNKLPVGDTSCPSDIRLDKWGVFYSLSGQSITENCCNSLGGIWDQGSCTINVKGGNITPIDPRGTGISSPSTPIGNGNTTNMGVSVEGSNNVLSSTTVNSMVLGDDNGISNYTPTVVVGDDNSVEGNNVSVYGDTNTVITNVSGSFIVGSNNTFVTSSLSSSITSSITNVVILGVDNVIASSSYHAYLPTNVVISGSDANINGIPLNTLTSASLGWPGVLAIENETGPNNPLITTGSYIGSTTNPGNGKILFSDNDPNDVNLRSTDTTSSAFFTVDPYSIYSTSTQFKVNQNAFLTDDNTINSITSFPGDSNAVFIGTNNSTISGSIVNSVIVGGKNNNLESNISVILGGEDNSMTNSGGVDAYYNVIVGGFQNNINDSDTCSILAGESNTIDNGSTYSTIIGGTNNTIDDATTSVIIGAGGVTATFNNTVYQHDSYRDANHTVQTTNNTITNLYTFTPDTNGVWLIEWMVTGFENATGDAIGAKVFSTFKVIAGVVTQVSTQTIDRKSNFPAGVTVTLDTDGTLIRCRVTGRTASTINWKGSLTITK